MPNKIIFLFLIVSFNTVFSQHSNSFYAYRTSQVQYFSKEVCNTYDPNALMHFLQNTLNCELKLDATSKNPFSTTFAFSQTKNGIPVYHGSIKVILDNNNPNIMVSSVLFNGLPETKSNIADICWFYNVDRWVMAKKAIVLNRDAGTLDEIITDLNGNLILKTDLALRKSAIDTTVRVKVFNPDPLTSAHKTYGAPYMDYNDSNVAELNAERVWKNVTCVFESDTFWLRNNYLVPFKFSSTVSYDPVFKVNDTVFDYTRNQHEFEDVMVFYHITTFQNYLNGLGYDTLGYRPMNYDAHGQKTDNSMFLPGYGLIYGTGGIDDAEDAPTIIHEYAHSLREFASPSTNNGFERQAIEEGMMDYFATSYKMGIDSFGWRKFGYWDGNNPPAYSGRSVASDKIYPQGLTGNLYSNSEIWSSALMRVHLKLGKLITDKLCIQSLYYLGENLSMPQTALLIIKADSAIYGGIHTETIWRTFAETHILPWYNGINNASTSSPNPILLINSVNFMQGKGDLIVTCAEEINGTYTITNNLGQMVLSNNFIGNSFTLPVGSIKTSGIYYLNITTPNWNGVKKLIIQ